MRSDLCPLCPPREARVVERYSEGCELVGHGWAAEIAVPTRQVIEVDERCVACETGRINGACAKRDAQWQGAEKAKAESHRKSREPTFRSPFCVGDCKRVCRKSGAVSSRTEAPDGLGEEAFCVVGCGVGV